MYYIQLVDSVIAAVYQDMDEAFLESLDADTVSGLRQAFEKNIEGAVSFESLPADFDWDHITRYSIDENHNIIDNGWEEPPREQTTEELLLEMAGDHEYRLCLMELGVNENDL